MRTWFAQDDELARSTTSSSELQAVNADLQQEVDALQTHDGITQAAATSSGYIQPSERRQTIVDLPDLPTDLPDGWPYGAGRADHRPAGRLPPQRHRPGG